MGKQDLKRDIKNWLVYGSAVRQSANTRQGERITGCLKEGEIRTLFYLWEQGYDHSSGGVKAVHISSAMACTPSMMHAYTESLEERNLVNLTKNRTQRGNPVLVKLTAKGNRHVEKIVEYVSELAQRVGGESF